MILRKLTLENFRGFKEKTVIPIEKGVTAFLGKNDVGKSTIMDALNIFFNDGIDAGDASVGGNPNNVRIACSFSDFPEKIVIDSTRETTLYDEHLLDRDGLLTIERTFNCSLGKPKQVSYCAIANHPSNDGCGDLLELKIAQLKTRAKELGVDLTDVNSSVSSELRNAIWRSTQLVFEERPVSLEKEDGKKVSEIINDYLPIYSLFKSDRASTDQDAEAQDPMKVAIKQVTDLMEARFSEIKGVVEEKLNEVAQNTVNAISELAPDIAKQLVPRVSTKKLDSLFSVSLTGENDVPVNKRGSGVRRLILLGFFKAQAEKKRDEEEGKRRSIIYAIEEPETSQHPNNQRLLLDAFTALSEDGLAQVLLTTHTPVLAERLDENALRYVRRNDNGHSVEVLKVDNDLIRKEIVESLGVLPDNRIKLFIGVEGKNDINFFKAVSKNLFLLHPNDYDDLAAEEAKGTVVFIPMGGSNLQLWVGRLEGTGRRQLYFMDRDNQPPVAAKYQDQYDEFISSGYVAHMTERKELENYIPLSLLRSNFSNYMGGGLDFDDVPSLVAQTVHANSNSPRSWDELDDDDKGRKESAAKKKLNGQIAMLINTDELFDECDPNRELRGWLAEIHQMLNNE